MGIDVLRLSVTTENIHAWAGPMLNGHARPSENSYWKNLPPEHCCADNRDYIMLAGETDPSGNGMLHALPAEVIRCAVVA
jgi:hypothetical protein